MFSEAGGLIVGNDVTVSGIKVGSVSIVELDNGDALVGFTIDGQVRASASDTTAHIRTGTLLGERVLALDSAGSGTLDPQHVIPTTRTSSPYSLTDAVSELTSNTAATDTETLNQSLDTLADDARPDRSAAGPDVRWPVATFAVAEQPQRKPGRAAQDRRRRHRDPVRTQPADQHADPQSNDLLGVLNERRQAIVSLLANTFGGVAATDGSGADNEKELAPALERLNRINEMLERNRDNIAKALPGLAKYELTQGEIVANGAYYNALMPNIQPAQTSAAVPRLRVRIQPWGQRRPAAGQRRTAGRVAVPRQRHSATRRPSAAMNRSRLVTVAAVAAGRSRSSPGAAFLVRQVFFGPNTITAYFPTATSIYPGDEVRVSGVKVGKIDSITPEGTQTKMILKVDRDVRDSGRRQGRDRCAESGGGALRPAHAGLPEWWRTDHA